MASLKNKNKKPLSKNSRPRQSPTSNRIRRCQNLYLLLLCTLDLHRAMVSFLRFVHFCVFLWILLFYFCVSSCEGTPELSWSMVKTVSSVSGQSNGSSAGPCPGGPGYGSCPGYGPLRQYKSASWSGIVRIRIMMPQAQDQENIFRTPDSRTTN